MKNKILILSIFIIANFCLATTFGDYKIFVENVLEDIQKTNANNTTSEQIKNYQRYIPIVQNLTIIDQRVKDALITFFNAKIDQIDTSKININK
jgi:hypothetical protein